MVKKIFILQTIIGKTMKEVMEERQEIQQYIAFTIGISTFTEINATLFSTEDGDGFEEFMKQLIDMSDTVVAQSGYEVSELCKNLHAYAEEQGKEIYVREN